MPPPASTVVNTLDQWSRPSGPAPAPPTTLWPTRGVRPISPVQTTSVSSSRPRCSQVLQERAEGLVGHRAEPRLQVEEVAVVRVLVEGHVSAAVVLPEDRHQRHAGLAGGAERARSPATPSSAVATETPASGSRR